MNDSTKLRIPLVLFCMYVFVGKISQTHFKSKLIENQMIKYFNEQIAHPHLPTEKALSLI